MSETLKLTASESVRIVNSSAASLEVEATYGAGGEAPPAHLHPAQDEHSEVLGGSLRVRIDGIDRELAAGDTLDVPRGSVHQMWNPGTEGARVRWTTTPAGRTEQWFRELNELQLAGRRLRRLARGLDRLPRPARPSGSEARRGHRPALSRD